MHPIKTYRLSHRLSRHDLAKKLGVSYAAVTHWENGLSKPSASHLIALAKIFGCTMDELLEKYHTQHKGNTRTTIYERMTIMKKAHIDLESMLNQSRAFPMDLLPEEDPGVAAWNAPVDPRDHDHHIGMRLYAARMELGCTLNHLAYRSGLSRQLLKNIEDLNVTVSYDIVERIADAFNMSADDLLNFGNQRVAS